MPTLRAACAANGQGDLHVLPIDNNGGLWHTIRDANGNWPFPFGDVLVATGGNIGPTQQVACAAAGGELHVLAIDNNGGLWHTIRAANGNWVPFGDVLAVTGAN